MEICCTVKKENLQVNFGHKDSLISIQEQPPIKVSALEVMFLVLLVEAFSLWWKGPESQVAKRLPTYEGKHPSLGCLCAQTHFFDSLCTRSAKY